MTRRHNRIRVRRAASCAGDIASHLSVQKTWCETLRGFADFCKCRRKCRKSAWLLPVKRLSTKTGIVRGWRRYGWPALKRGSRADGRTSSRGARSPQTTEMLVPVSRSRGGALPGQRGCATAIGTMNFLDPGNPGRRNRRSDFAAGRWLAHLVAENEKHP